MIEFFDPYIIDINGNQIKAEFHIQEKKGCYTYSVKMLETAKVREAVLFVGSHGFAANADFYGDGYQKLSQYGGTVSSIKNIASFTDKDHYKMPQTHGYHTSYNYICVTENKTTKLIGATSCNRFRTEFRINQNSLIVAQPLEGLVFQAGDIILLEEIAEWQGEKNNLLSRFGMALSENHKTKVFSETPVGWCSWYCIGPNISEKDVFKNLAVIKEKAPELKYIQIDDGFQPFMGDWLETGDKFKRPMKEICRDIKKAGFEPAIWLAPFIASPKSRLLREHPDYFVKDAQGAPLCSKEVTFSGWRDGPWYFLDGTNPDAQKFLFEVVNEIYHNWGVKYFKLDANVWGALPFGQRYDPNATCIEAYRRGMEAIWKAVDNDAYIMGCNAPMWPSLGLVSGMRITGDICRNTKYVAKMSLECFHRNWMNHTLWLNDPDCVLMASSSNTVMDAGGKTHSNPAKKKFYKFNNVYARASGGVILSGDYVHKYTDAHIQRMRRLIDAPHIAAKFDEKFEVGVIESENATEYCVFNRSFFPKEYELPVPQGCIATDMYLNEVMEKTKGKARFTLSRYGAAWIKIGR